MWNDLLERVQYPKEEVTVALVGKYIDLPDAYLSVTEALRAGGFANWAKVTIRWVASDECDTPEGARQALAGVDGICVPGGFGIRGVEGKVGAIRFARENAIPTLGLCLGLQCMVIEVARDLAGIEDADSSEFNAGSTNPVIATMAEQEHIVDGGGDLGGSMRLGSYPHELVRGTLVHKLYGKVKVEERHRHRYEVNNGYRERLEKAGLVISGTSPDRGSGRVHRTSHLGAPVLRRHPGASGTEVPSHPAAPVVQGADRGGAAAQARRRLPVEE